MDPNDDRLKGARTLGVSPVVETVEMLREALDELIGKLQDDELDVALADPCELTLYEVTLILANGEADVVRVLNIEAVNIEELRTVGHNIPASPGRPPAKPVP